VPTEREFVKVEMFGKKLPKPMPISIARKIQSVK
jgi:hypothetical protein